MSRRTLPERQDYDAFAKKYARRQEVRITIIDMDGTVLGESEESPSDMENHKDREEVKKAMTGESASIVRRSSTLGMDLLLLRRSCSDRQL